MLEVIEDQPVKPIEARRTANAERQSAWKAGIKAEAVAAQMNPRQRGKKRALIMLLDDKFPDYQPVLEMAAKAHRLSTIADQRPSDSIAQMDCVNAHEKVAKYVTPQLKAIDLTSGGEQIQFGFQMNLATLIKT